MQTVKVLHQKSLRAFCKAHKTLKPVGDCGCKGTVNKKPVGDCGCKGTVNKKKLKIQDSQALHIYSETVKPFQHRVVDTHTHTIIITLIQ